MTGAPFATAVSDCQIDPIAMLNGDVKWIGETGEYSYSAQVLLDKKRGIGLSSVDFNWWVMMMAGIQLHRLQSKSTKKKITIKIKMKMKMKMKIMVGEC